MKNNLLILIAVFILSGCLAQRQTIKKEINADSTPILREGVSTNSFCLHVKFHSNDFIFYQENYAEGWITDGRCTTNGPRRPVQSINLRWHYTDNHKDSKQCNNTEICAVDDRRYNWRRIMDCSAATANDGGWTATASTDRSKCQ